jgi:hypothetical protein
VKSYKTVRLFSMFFFGEMAVENERPQRQTEKKSGSGTNMAWAVEGERRFEVIANG